MNTIDTLAAFRSRQQAIAFDLELHAAAIDSQVISTPPSISQGCGVSVAFAHEDMQRIIGVGLLGRYTSFDGIFQLQTQMHGRLRWVRIYNV